MKGLEIDKAELSASQSVYYDFWNNFIDLSEHNFEFKSNFTQHQIKTVRNYLNFNIGKSHYNLVVKLLPKKNCYCMMAYFRNKALFQHIFNTYKVQIESEIGKQMDWDMHEKKSSASFKIPMNLDEREKWNSISLDIINYFILLRKVFIKYT